MAATLAATRLTEAHRVAQGRIGVRTALQMAQVWPLLDSQALDATTGRWLTAARAIVAQRAAESAALAGAYATAYRAAELGEVDPDFTVVPMVPLDERAVSTSLVVTGPVQVKGAVTAGRTLAVAFDLARAASAAAAQRHALNAGRQVLADTADADPAARGWARVPSSRCCAFCAMLASRGPEYGSRGSASFEAHDRCGCTVEPHYRGDGLNPQSRRFRGMWDATTSGVPSGDKVAAFRAVIDGATTA